MKTLTPWKKPTDVAKARDPMSPFGSLAFPLVRMRDEFARLFDRMAQEFTALADGDGWRWGLEVEDRDDAFVVRAEAPGFDAGDFELRVEDGRLELRAAKKTEAKDEKGEVRERRERECCETVALPSPVDKDKTEASYRNGVLTVTLPKTAAGKAKRIAVKPG